MEMNKENPVMSNEVTTDLKPANDSEATKAIATTNGNKDVIVRNLAVLEDYRTFALSLKDTDLGARFKENKQIDGKVTEIVNIDNMVTCLLTGNEIGLSPMTSLAYGRNLNLDAIQKVELGKTLGLSVTASLKNIFVFESGGTRQVYTGINVVEGCLNKHNIDIEIVEDFVPVYSYIDLSRNGMPILEFDENHHIDVGKYNDNYVQKMMAEKGMIPVSKVIETYRTTAKLTRRGKETKISYTLQEAIDAGLKSGINSVTKEKVKGKDNWDKHTRSLMRKMAIMLAARICANDIINGMYADIEIKEAQTIDSDDTDSHYVDAEILN